ncbi:MAG: SAM-dependent methyltransferase [Candidatus Hinthialibacter antarcticus]|nr:SAM-dependent methyltransferase [Candidatus Hinthialibacter antarcticus]
MTMPISPTQLLFLRSIIDNAIAQQSGPLSIFVNKYNQSLIALFESESPDQDFHCSLPDGNSEFIPREITTDILFDLSDNASFISLDDGSKVVRLTLENNKVSRETLESNTQPLNTARWAVGKSTHLDPNQAAPLLKTIGLMTPDGDVKAPMRKKFKQVNHFIELMAPLLEKPASGGAYHIVDCGCGKSYLGFALVWYIRNVLKRKAAFLGIDISDNVIQQCRSRAQTLGLNEMRFQCASMREADWPKQVDLLTSLHACDTATDEALACGAARHAKRLVAVPCCQHELAEQIESAPHYPITRHGLFKQRFADMLTDMSRSLFLESRGYRVTVGEFVSVEESPKNLMLRAEKKSDSSSQRESEYDSFKSFYGIRPSIDSLYLEQKFALH